MKQKLIRNEHDWCVSMLEFWHSYSNSFAFIRIVKFFIISLSALAHAWMSQVFFWIRYTKRGFDSFFICTVRGFFLAHLSLFDWNWASNLLDSLFSFSPFSLDSREFYAGNGYKKNQWFFWLRIYVEIFLMIEGEVFIPAITINSSYLFFK